MKINFKVSNKLDKAGLKVVKLLHANNFQAFWVGGIIRNILLKRKSNDIDIATDAKPDDIEKILQAADFNTKPVGKKFGSILAIVDGFQIEITTFRAESRYSDRRHPDLVQFIEKYFEDAKRRDFTVNALYFDPIKKEMYDPTSGLKDLKGKLMRFVGDPKKRIDEDALRMLRGVRFATQLGFKIEKNSFAAIKTRAKYIQEVSGERIKAELDKILLSENRVEGIKLLDKIGLLKFIIPEIEPLKTFTHRSKLYHLEGNMFDHTMLALSQTKSKDLNLVYALLFHDIGKPLVGKKIQKAEGLVISTKGHADVSAGIFLKFSKKLKFSRKSRDTAEWLIKNHMLQTNFWEMRPGKQIKVVSHPAFALLLEHWSCDHHGTIRAESFGDHDVKFEKSLRAGRKLLQSLKTAEPLLKKLASGELIMKYGNLKSGPAVGQKINRVKTQIILGKIRNEKDLQTYLK